jgi:hypothetical protein
LEEGDDSGSGFEPEYRWENFILRLWLYRTTVKSLEKMSVVKSEAQTALNAFDSQFNTNGINGLKALRDMLEHFDDYAAGSGRGPGKRERDLDPWREVTRDQYERGAFFLDRHKSYAAAIQLRADAKIISDRFIDWYKSAS